METKIRVFTMAGEDNEHRVIRKDYSEDPSMDFAFLRSKGIELVQYLSGSHWTDFNLHDPGVTILENICYAITDLAYRTDFPLVDLLTDSTGSLDNAANSFISHKEILTTAAVSVNDFRKLLIDQVDEVVNAWIRPIKSDFSNEYVKGSYEVIIKPDTLFKEQFKSSDGKTFEEDIKAKVRKILATSRTIGEDIDEIIILEPQKIQVRAQIIIRKSAVPEELLAQVIYRIKMALSDHVRFYTEQELLAKDYTIEQIYNGPLLNQGIIIDDDLKEIRNEVDPSELIKPISDMFDILHIKKFEIKYQDSGVYGNRPLKLDVNRYPELELNPPLLPEIKLYHDHLLLPVNASVVYKMLARLEDSLKKTYVREVHKSVIKTSPTGTYRNVEEYVSIQEMFPAIYRIGREGIEKNAPVERKAYAKQLKAYLLFFEQILAGYLSQLANVSKLYSADIEKHGSSSYFFQPLYMVPDVAPLIKAFTDSNGETWASFMAKTNGYTHALQIIAESDDIFRARKNKVFDHLLSRFNIIPDKYPVILYDQIYNAQAVEKRMDEVLMWKSNLVTNIFNFNNFRTKAFNYFEDARDIQIAPGLEYNMRLLLHIKNKKISLSKIVSAYLDTPPKTRKSVDSADSYGSTPSQEKPVRSILVDGEELKITPEDNVETFSSFKIGQQSIDFFDSGINMKNYKIISDDTKGKVLVIYKSEKEEQWHIIRQYQERKDARKGLKELVEKLIEVSRESEGFHLIEHLLLAPSKLVPIFGFTFYDDAGNKLLEHGKRVSFYEREKLIKDILEVAKETDIKNPYAGYDRISKLCKVIIPANQDGNKATAYRHMDIMVFKLINSLQEWSIDQKKYLPRFAFDVSHWGELIIPEDFFNAQVTVVFPSWPARFQKHGFKEFAENTIRNNMPVHIKTNFLWLNISRMIKMEEYYFRWLDTLKNEDPNVRRMESSRFLPFFYNELKRG